jgi:hypothetical protein
MIAATYGTKPTALDQFMPTHLTSTDQKQLLKTLTTYKRDFDNQLGELPGKPVSLVLKKTYNRPYHGRAFPVPQVHHKLIKDELQRLVDPQVLPEPSTSEWAAPSVGIPKKNHQIRFVSDFRQLNKRLRRMPFHLLNP